MWVKFNSWLVSELDLAGLAIQLEVVCSEASLLAGGLVEVTSLQESKEVHDCEAACWALRIHGRRCLLALLDDLVWNGNQVLL